MGQNTEKTAVLTVDETAAKLRMSRNAIYEAIKAKEIPSIRVGRRILVPSLALDRMLAGEKTAA